MSVIKISKENFEDEVIKSPKTVLLDFYADWCGPCRMVAPVIAELSKERTDVKFCKINVDEEEELAEKFNIFSIPALVVMKDGRIVAQEVGYRPKSEIEKILH